MADPTDRADPATPVDPRAATGAQSGVAARQAEAAGPHAGIVAETEIVPCADGPILVRGRFTIVGATGPSVDRGRRTVALCRCGLSQRKPFCDGTHRATGFRTDDAPPPTA